MVYLVLMTIKLGELVDQPRQMRIGAYQVTVIHNLVTSGYRCPVCVSDSTHEFPILKMAKPESKLAQVPAYSEFAHSAYLVAAGHL